MDCKLTANVSVVKSSAQYEAKWSRYTKNKCYQNTQRYNNHENYDDGGDDEDDDKGNNYYKQVGVQLFKTRNVYKNSIIINCDNDDNGDRRFTLMLAIVTSDE